MPPKAKQIKEYSGAETCRLKIRPKVKADYAPGDSLPQGYVVDEIIARGGSGLVVKAHKPAIHPPIYKAIKLVNSEISQESADSRNIIQSEFYSEAEVSFEIGSDPYAIGVEDIIEMPDETRALVFPYVTGHTLSSLNNDHIEQGYLLPFEIAAFIGHRILSTLCHARERGIAHRDLCLNNVMIQRTGTPMLLDWGAGSHINDGIMVGKPGYIAPEVIRDPESLTRDDLYKSDIFSLGAIMRELITGSNALDPAADSPKYDPYGVIEKRFKMNTDKLIPVNEICCDVPQALAEIVSACLRDNSDDRPSAEELYDYMGGHYLYTPQVGFGHTAETLEHYMRFFYGAPAGDKPLPDDKTGRSLAKIIAGKYRRFAEQPQYQDTLLKKIAAQQCAEYICGNVYRTFEEAYGANKLESLVYGLCRGALRDIHGKKEELAGNPAKQTDYDKARGDLDNMSPDLQKDFLKNHIQKLTEASPSSVDRLYIQQVFQQIRRIKQFSA